MGIFRKPEYYNCLIDVLGGNEIKLSTNWLRLRL